MNNTEIKKVTRKPIHTVKGWVDKFGSSWVRIVSHKESEIITNSQGDKIELLPASEFFTFKTNQYDFSGIGYVQLEIEPYLTMPKGSSYIDQSGWIRSAKFKNNESGKIENVPALKTVLPAAAPKQEAKPKEDEVKMSDIF